MPNQRKESDVVYRKGNYELSKRETGASLTDSRNRSRSLDVDVNKRDRSIAAGPTWKW